MDWNWDSAASPVKPRNQTKSLDCLGFYKEILLLSFSNQLYQLHPIQINMCKTASFFFSIFAKSTLSTFYSLVCSYSKLVCTGVLKWEANSIGISYRKIIICTTEKDFAGKTPFDQEKKEKRKTEENVLPGTYFVLLWQSSVFRTHASKTTRSKKKVKKI